MLKKSFWIFLLVVLVYGYRHFADEQVRYTDSVMFDVTGERHFMPQVRAVGQIVGGYLRGRPDVGIYVSSSEAMGNRFGINTFLEQEVDPDKRDRQFKIISEAGFKYVRQEFPWADIEIHNKGEYLDRRNELIVNSWSKYDDIVSLSELYDVELIARLSAPPEWSREGGVKGTFAPPVDFNDYADFVYNVVDRYNGRVKYFQIWNEPNIYPEWGEQPVDPEQFTKLLCLAYSAAKSANPNSIVVAPALAPTVSLTKTNLNEFIFLVRMYDAGAAECFDIMSAQGYGIWSGPTDRRVLPGVVNFSRHLYIRDIMVVNDDSNKPIWISEMNWNALPEDGDLYPYYGRVTLEEQAEWVPIGYERMKKEWPWITLANFWYFKRADYSEIDQSWYYFRMASPDFDLMPVYYTVKEYISGESN